MVVPPWDRRGAYGALAPARIVAPARASDGRRDGSPAAVQGRTVTGGVTAIRLRPRAFSGAGRSLSQ